MATQQQATRTRATYEDYLNTPEGERYELLDGELVMAPSPNMRHQEIAARLFVLLYLFVEESTLGKVFDAPSDVVLWESGHRRVVQPDLLFISAARVDIITEANVQGAPDLVVEILSPSTERTDRGYKRDLYALNGVGEYWQVEPNAGSITVLLLGDGDYELGGIYGPGDTLASPALPGLNLDVARIFGQA